MSDNHFPHPNEHPHDDDLQPERRTDASISDADALDALLNEIAQDSGSPNTRSGHGHERPDVRIEDNDHASEADTLHAATRSFHQRLAAAQAGDPGAAALDPTLWETIMTTTARPKRTPGDLWREASTSTLPPTAASGSRVPPPASHRTARNWGGFANATLALVILLAGFGIWRFYDGLNSTGTPDPDPTASGIAMQPATPEATETVTAPVATPAPSYACDFTGDIPIFQQVATSPVEGTALLLTTTGDLVLTCPDEPNPIVLASGVNVGQVGPAGYPGLVSYFTPPTETGAAVITYLNVLNGKTVIAGIPPEGAMASGTDSDGVSPWLVTNSFDNPGIWEITDLRTMESRTFNVYADPESLSGGTMVPPGMPVMIATAADTLVIGIMTNNDIDREGALFDVQGLPGTLLVLNGSFDNAHWIDVPGDLANIRGMDLSPDGQHLALMSNSESEVSPDNVVTYSIVRTSDGAELARSEGIGFQDSVPSMRWVQDGRAIAYTDNESLMVLAAEESAQPETVLQSDALLVDLGTTYDPNVVLVTRQQPEEVATETPDLVQPLTYSVNTVTGEAIKTEGVDVSHNISPWEPDTRFLVMGDTYIQWMDADTATFRIVDAVTGETIDEITGIQISQDPSGPAMGPRAVVSTADGSVEVIGFSASQIYLLHETEGGPKVRHLPSPIPDAESYVSSLVLWLSDDGTQLSLTIDGDESLTRYLIDLTDPEAEWLGVPPAQGSVEPGYGPANIFFVPGAGS